MLPQQTVHQTGLLLLKDHLVRIFLLVLAVVDDSMQGLELDDEDAAGFGVEGHVKMVVVGGLAGLQMECGELVIGELKFLLVRHVVIVLVRVVTGVRDENPQLDLGRGTAVVEVEGLDVECEPAISDASQWHLKIYIVTLVDRDLSGDAIRFNRNELFARRENLLKHHAQ